MNFVVTFVKRGNDGAEVSRDTVIDGTWNTIVRQAHSQAGFPELIVRIAEAGYHK